MLLLIYTGCRPAELVDAAKAKTTSHKPSGKTKTQATSCKPSSAAKVNSSTEKQAYEDDDWDSGYDSPGETNDPVYDSLEPWTNLDNPDYNDDDQEDTPVREYKALCYEDIRLWIVQNPTRGERDLVAMEITLSHHKGADRKPKPYVLDPRFLLC
jgi:hypothetical protein